MAERERKALTREQGLAQELEEFDLPDFDLHLVETRALDMDAAMADADDEALSDRDFAARAVADA